MDKDTGTDYAYNYDIQYNATKPLIIMANIITFIDNKELEFDYNGSAIKSLDKYLEIDGENSTYTDLSISTSKVTIITEDGSEYEYDTKDASFKKFDILLNAGTYIIKINVNDLYLNSKRIGDNLNYYSCSQETITLTIVINKFELTGSAYTYDYNFFFDPNDLDYKFTYPYGYSSITPTAISERTIGFNFVPFKDENGNEITPYVDINNKTCENKLDLHVYFTDTGEDITSSCDLSNINISYGTLTLTSDVTVNGYESCDYTSLDYNNLGPTWILTDVGNVNLNIETQYILKDELDINSTFIDSINEVGTYYILYKIDSVNVNGTYYEDYSFLNLIINQTFEYDGETYYVLQYYVSTSTLYLKPYVTDSYVFNGDNVCLSADQNEIVYGSIRQNQYIECEFSNNEIGIIEGKLKKSVTPKIIASHIYDEEGNEVTSNYDIKYEYDDFLKNKDEYLQLKGKDRYSYKFNVNKTLSYSNRYVVYKSFGGSFTYDNEYHQVTIEPTIINDYNSAIEQINNRVVTEENYGLLDGYYYQVKSYGSYKFYNSRGYKNTVSFKTYTEDGIDVSSVFTYLISNDSELVYINQKDVIVTSESASAQFGDVLELYDHTISSIEGLLDNGDHIDLDSIVWTGINSTVGSKENTFVVTKILNAKGQDVTSNYNIIYVYGTLTITL